MASSSHLMRDITTVLFCPCAHSVPGTSPVPKVLSCIAYKTGLWTLGYGMVKISKERKW